ncbi:MAG TPA: alcohol dehydrogenase catalytic domain-containing protein [Nitrososphaeraceae archaeon]|nr:alcohol dehydrogenase catalytic domain-containing protein [Nitrososphaeraceae archaeon]
MQVHIKIQACGTWHSDSFTKEGLFPDTDIQYPRVPGHKIAGIIDMIGKDVTTNTEWKTRTQSSCCWLASWRSLWPF